MSILEILEAHTCHTHTTPHSIGYWARCTCGWTSEGQQSNDYDFTPEHRAHVAQVLEQELKEVELNGVTAQMYISDFDGMLVAQIDTIELKPGASIRVNLNDGPIWNGDPESHHHTKCNCCAERGSNE